MLPSIPFYMIRHGESVANLGEYASGNIDVELTPRGLEQARTAQKIVESLEVKPSLIVHSHLQRARITAEILNENLGLPMVQDSEIAEQNYGDWEGQPWSLSRQPIRDFIDPPNGETHAAFGERVKATITRHVNDNKGPIMIVCHGGVFRALGALYGEKIYGVENCSLHHFEPVMTQAAFPWNIRRF